jgi:hypothetical protein
MNAIIYLKGWHLVDGEKTNHIVISIRRFADVDNVLAVHDLTLSDINIIDFR